MKVFLDANVLFSASLVKSRMALFLEILRKKADLCSSLAAVDEARCNLERKVDADSPAIANLKALLQKIHLSKLEAELPSIELVAKDRHILRAAVASQCTHLLTGDERHFKHLFGKTVLDVKIVHAAMLAEEIGLTPNDSRSAR